MTRREFIEELTRELGARLSGEQGAELLEDFNAHFDEALRTGKTEEAICAVLGTPREIAAQFPPTKPGQALLNPLGGLGDGGVRYAPEGGSLPGELFVRLREAELHGVLGEGENFRITVLVHGEAADERTIRIAREGGRLSIIQDPDTSMMRRFFHGIVQKTVEVVFPRRFRGDLDIAIESGNLKLEGPVLDGGIGGVLQSGNIEVYDVSVGKAFTLRSASGNVRLRGCSGKAELSCASGNVTVEGHRGNVRALSASGNVHLETDRLTEETALKTASGNLHLSVDALEADLGLRCHSGNIHFDIRELGGNIRGKTGSGNIHGILPAGTKARFVLRTEGIHNDFAEENLSSSPSEPPVVELSSGSGQVRIEKR